MVNVFGSDSTGEEGSLGNLQVLRKVKDIQASHKLGYPAYRIASAGSPTLVFTYENKVFCLGAHHKELDELTSLAVTNAHYRAYWKEDSSSSSATSIKDKRGIQGKRAVAAGTCIVGECDFNYMDSITTSRSISVEELREESNLIIYIVGLLLLIIWEVTMLCQVCLHRQTQPLGEIGEELEIPDPMAVFGNDKGNGIAHKANSIPPKAYV